MVAHNDSEIAVCGLTKAKCGGVKKVEPKADHRLTQHQLQKNPALNTSQQRHKPQPNQLKHAAGKRNQQQQTCKRPTNAPLFPTQTYSLDRRHSIHSKNPQSQTAAEPLATRLSPPLARGGIQYLAKLLCPQTHMQFSTHLAALKPPTTAWCW